MIECRSLIAVIAVALLTGSSMSIAQSTGSASLEREVKGQQLTSMRAVEVAIEVIEPFDYVGGQRFILRGHTDVEQHFFVVSNEMGNVERMYWFQFEEKLPGNEGRYSYPQSDISRLGDLEFATQVRRYDTEPVADSDRGAAYRYLAEAGYLVPTPAIRSRLVHIPEGNGRQELMIVYLEQNNAIGELPAAERHELVSRAVAGLSLKQPD